MTARQARDRHRFAAAPVEQYTSVAINGERKSSGQFKPLVSKPAVNVTLANRGDRNSACTKAHTLVGVNGTNFTNDGL